MLRNFSDGLRLAQEKREWLASEKGEEYVQRYLDCYNNSRRKEGWADDYCAYKLSRALEYERDMGQTV